MEATRPDHVWHCDLTVVPTAMGYWLPWFPLSVVLGWPFAWWVVGVVDQYSRAVIAVKAFGKQPDSADVTAFLEAAIATAGRAPEHLISDRGVQFQADYRDWCTMHGIKPRWGAIGSHKSIAIIERFWRSLNDECCRRIVVPAGLLKMQSELDVYVAWYNEHRPHRALSGATPVERRAESVAEQDLLRAARSLCSFEDREQQTPSRSTLPKHIPDIQPDELVLPQARAEGHRVQHMIAVARSVLAGDLEQGSLLAFGQGPWGACPVGVVRHRWG